MIFDRNFPVGSLIQFLEVNDAAFTKPLSLVLKKQNMTLESYAQKLSSVGTIACEFDGNGGEIKGLVIGYTHNLPQDGGSYITQVVTGQNYRRQGVCKRLLREYFDYCEKFSDADYIWLTTASTNMGAQAAYEDAGFLKTESCDPLKIRYEYSIRKQNSDKI